MTAITNSTGSARIAVVGAGLIGRRHIDLVRRGATLAAIVDPNPEAAELAQSYDVPGYRDLETCLEDVQPDGVILATPNHLHATQAQACISGGIPVLIEKPIADTSAAAAALVDQAEAAGVPILVGHHRRHNPLIAAAAQAIQQGRLGQIVAVHANFWLYKPQDYFLPEWRRAEGAGPVFINLIHDIDLIRHLCGEVASVQAMQSSKTRGFAVEDTATVLLEFVSGALGTVTVSDTVVAPWSWEFTSAENPAYPNMPASCYMIGGTRASLSVPDLRIWRHPGARDWWEPMEAEKLSYEATDPLVAQLRHFVDLVRGIGSPLVSGCEGLMSLRLVEAIKRAAASGQRETL